MKESLINKDREAKRATLRFDATFPNADEI